MSPEKEGSGHHRWSISSGLERWKRRRRKPEKAKDKHDQPEDSKQHNQSPSLLEPANEEEDGIAKSILPKPKDDLWIKAFERLDPDMKKKLRERGMDESCSIPMKKQAAQFQKEAKNIQKVSDEKQWRFPVKGQEIMVRDLTTRIVDWAIKISDVATKLAQDTTPAGGVLGIASLFLQQIQNFDTEKQALLSIADKVAQAMFLGQLYFKIYTPELAANTDVVVHLHQAIVELYLSVLTLLAMSSDLASSTVVQFCRSTFNNRQPSGVLAELDANITALEKAVWPCEATAKARERELYKIFFLETQLFQSQLFQKLNASEWEEIQHWISKVPYGNHHQDIENERKKELGDWLIQHESFFRWMDSDSNKVLLLQGSPGAGKTYLISNVVAYFKSQIASEGVGFAYFFCNRGEDSRRKAMPILRSLVRQLATTDSMDHSMRTTLRVAWEKSKKDDSELGRSECQNQLSECFAAYSTTFIVLDALDEVDRTELRSLMTDIRNAIPSTGNKVKLLFASRPGTRVFHDFQSIITIEAKDNYQDIKRYVEGEIRKFIDEDPRSAVSEKKQDIVLAIMDKCDNMFLWAYLQIRHVLGCETREAIDHALESLPRGLDKTYDRIYADFELLEAPDRNLAERAFKWVDAAPEPLTTEEILSAVRVEPVTLRSVDPIEKERMLSMCKSFLVVDSSDHWRYFHLSAREYLDKKHDDKNRSRQHDAFSFCAEICFRSLLLSFDSENITFAQASPTEDGNPNRFESPFHPANPFARHCQTYWPFYATKQDINSASIRFLEQFLGSPTDGCSTYLEWFRYASQFRPPKCHIMHNQVIASNSEVKIQILAGQKYEDIAKAPVFAVAYLVLYKPLQRWWDNSDISPLECSYDGSFLLTVAVQSKLRPLCAHLIARGRSLDKREFDLCLTQALFAAADQGNIEMVKYLVQEGANAALPAPSKELWCEYSSPVDPAARLGNLELVKYLIEEARAPIGDALFWAAGTNSGEGELAVIKYLIENKKADPNLPPIRHRYESPLVGAALFGRRDILAYFVENTDIDVNALYKTEPESYGHGNALCAMVSWESLEDVKYLVEVGKADVNLLPEFGSCGSALSTAAGQGKLDIVQYLVETAGADVNSQLKVGRYGSALTEALAYRKLEIFDYLLPRAQVNLSLLSGGYGSAFAAAFDLESPMYNVNMDIVRRLVAAGADVNMCHKVGEFGSPFVRAAFEVTDLEVIEYLVNVCKADIHARHSTGHYGSALAAAAHAGNLPVVKYLLSSEEDVDFTFSNGAYGSVLVAAAMKRHNMEVLKCLLNSGALPDLDLQVGPFGSPLAAAVGQGELEQVAYLVEQGKASVKHLIHTGSFGSALAAAIVAPFDFSTNIRIMTKFEGSELDIDLRAQDGPYGETLVLASAIFAPPNTREHAFRVFKYLVDGDVDVNLELKVGAYGNALIAASATGNLDQVEYLVKECKADLNRPPRTGSFGSALAAVVVASSRIRKLNPNVLVDSFMWISVHLYDQPMITPSRTAEGYRIKSRAYDMLHAMIDSLANIMTFLVESGANPDLELNAGPYGSALAAAAATGSLQNVKFLVEKAKANVNLELTTGDYPNACDAAATHEHHEIVEYLTQAGRASSLLA